MSSVLIVDKGAQVPKDRGGAPDDVGTGQAQDLLGRQDFSPEVVRTRGLRDVSGGAVHSADHSNGGRMPNVGTGSTQWPQPQSGGLQREPTLTPPGIPSVSLVASTIPGGLVDGERPVGSNPIAGPRPNRARTAFLLGALTGLLLLAVLALLFVLNSNGEPPLGESGPSEAVAGVPPGENEPVADAANGIDELATMSRVVIRTHPTGLQLVDAVTHQPLGNSPLTLRLTPGATPPPLRARLGKRYSKTLKLPAGATDAEFHLTRWASASASSSHALYSTRRRRVRRARARRAAAARRTTISRPADATRASATSPDVKAGVPAGDSAAEEASSAPPLITPVKRPKTAQPAALRDLEGNPYLR